MKYIYIAILSLISSTLIEAQCYLDRHNTNWYDAWISCETNNSPNSVRGKSHWLLYNLGHVYRLSDTKIWNYNDPKNLDYGVKTIAIDYSLDGFTWTTLGNFEIEKGTGSKNYEGQVGPDLQKIEAKYLLVTVLATHGGNCAALGELKIDVQVTTANEDIENAASCITTKIYPNPFTTQLQVQVKNNCQDKEMTAYLVDLTGKIVTSKIQLQNGKIHNVPIASLSNGVYTLVVDSEYGQNRSKVVKVE